MKAFNLAFLASVETNVSKKQHPPLLNPSPWVGTHEGLTHKCSSRPCYKKTPRSDPLLCPSSPAHTFPLKPRLFLPMKDIQTRAGSISAPVRLWAPRTLRYLLEMAAHHADLFSVRQKPHLKVVFFHSKCLTRRAPTALEPC